MMLPIVSQLDKAHPQGSICRALDISRSGLHHARQHRDRPVCDLRTETLFKAIFAEHQQTYGSRRIAVCWPNAAWCLDATKCVSC